ncbi:hypothetical protein [Gimesia algae]|uniref:Uncharacterized protein n=1 Tax=Gimesia algae TaxID=2527971 RepID=A0A517VMH1_9PLAN|nr:hypothetical protein [Gimesia algae]QDT94214.1 hypothetical protein Pan161_59080 [Gimesia algae]
MDTDSPLPARKKRFPFMIVLAVLAMVVGYTLLVIEGRNLEYKKIKAVHLEFLELQKQNASNAEWQAFKQSVHNRIDPVIKELEQAATSGHPDLKLLFWASVDHMYPMLDNARVSKSRDQELFEKRLSQAEAYVFK